MTKNKSSRFAENYSTEERRIRVRMAERGIRTSDIAEALGIYRQDVSKVIRGNNPSPGYVPKVYRFLDLDMPNDKGPTAAAR